MTAQTTGRPRSRSAADLYGEALREGRRLRLVTTAGRRLPFPLDRWVAPADAVDEWLLDRCLGATLDVGCGPGRLSAALARRGQAVLGVDVAAAAVESTTSRGAPALLASVFEPLPGEGRWDTVLLADGNLGIGGDPDALLRRSRVLLRPGGRLVVEPEPRDVDEVVDLVLEVVDGPPTTSREFRWARVGPSSTCRRAAAAGFTVGEVLRSGGRCLVVLRT